MDYLDLVYLDDNPQAALESVVEAIGHEINNGRVRAFGVRNWTAEPIAAANAHLTHQGLPGVAAIVTTDLPLANSTEPLWPGYRPFGAGIRHMVRDRCLAVFAHGADFNLGQCLYGDADPTARIKRRWLERWEHPANIQLVRRVIRFAVTHRLTACEVNLAWLLNQPFPCAAILPLPSLLTSRRSEYEHASQFTLAEADRDLVRGGGEAA